ncbi:MAG: hypothetical protein KDB27_32965 [Planctomycetales bacterium]|nr:hypothetical protein [Planctomycetales bacterium]
MEFIFELLVQFLGELLVQLLMELGFRAIAEPFRTDRPANVFLALAGYILMGLIGGQISLWLMPEHFIDSQALRRVNLVVTPILLGFVFEVVGKYRQNHGKEKRLLDRFSYGFSFALTMGLIRYAFAR